MGAPSTDKVRNVVLVGQDGAGKTSLAEAMLFLSGKTNRMGTTHDGKSNLDYDPEEIKRKYTIATSLAPIPYKDFKINVIDTAGSPDFIGDTLVSMQAAEMALFVIDAVAGPQVMTSKLWFAAEKMRICRAVFINHIDREHADFENAMDTLTEKFGSRVGSVNIPMGVDADFKGVIDIIRMKARYNEQGGKERIEDIPAEYQDAADEAREKLCELVAEADDELMEKYLEGGQLSQDELEMLLDKAIAQGIFIPVFVGSTIIEQGVNALMDDIITYFPAPTAHGPIAMEDGSEVTIDADDRPAGYVFKTISDPYVGRLSFIKVIAGTLEPGMEIINSRTGKKDRLTHLYIMCGKDTEDVKSAKAGDIIVVPKLADAATGDTLCESGKIKVAALPFPKPLYPVAIEAENKNDEDKLGDFLSKACETDPTLELRRDEETHQTLITGLGEAQIDVILSRLKERTGISVKLVDVRVPYRESIRKSAQAQGRHKKQTGGAGQFGDCWLRVEPNPGGGYEFIDEVTQGRIPRGFIPAIDKGVKEMLVEGVLAGYPMVDIKVAVYDGSYHAVDSNEMAFKMAAHIGFKAACEKADLYLLEPMANMQITVDEEYAGAIMGDLPTKRGRVQGMGTNEAGNSVINARVPYAEVVQYAKQLRSLTRGSGEYTIEIDGYEEVPRDQAQKIIAAYQASRNEGK